MTKLRAIGIGLAALAVSSLTLTHYYLVIAVPAPTSVAGPVFTQPVSTSTVWACVTATGTALSGTWTTSTLAEPPCGQAVAADGVTRYLEERVTTTTSTTQTTNTRRFELQGGTTIKVSSAQAQLSIMSGGGGRGGSSSGGGGGSTPGAADPTQLPTNATPNFTAYDALNVPGMSAGASFDDPVTGTKTVKLTDSSTPDSGQHYNQYSTLGIQVSNPWGANSDKYTIWYLSASGGAQLLDYQLGGTITNRRAGPGGETTVTFSTDANNAQTMYVRTSGTQVRPYDTGTDSYTGTYTWTTKGSTDTWLQEDASAEWLVAKSATGVTAYKISDGTIINQTIGSIDDLNTADGYVMVNTTGSNTRQIWNLNSDSLQSMTSSAWGSHSRPFHIASLRGNYWTWLDTNTGSGTIPVMRASTDGTINTSAVMSTYWDQMHCTGFWQNGTGTDQYFIASFWGDYSGLSNRDADDDTAIMLIHVSDGARRYLGHSYSIAMQSGTNPGGTDSYRSQPHATPSPDGRVVIFSSNMNDSSRLEVLLMEMPLAVNDDVYDPLKQTLGAPDYALAA